MAASLAITAVLTAGLAAATAAPAAAAPAAAAPATASLSARPHRAGFSAISCKGASWCMAVGAYTDSSGARHAMAQEWNGTRWRVLKNPPGRPPASLSCSAPWFCMASGGPTGAETWNGRSWRTMKSPPGGVNGVSCGSRKTCMVIYQSVVQSWNGRRWRIWRQATNACGGPPGLPCGLAGVSCGSASNCVAVGTQTISQEPVQNTIGFFWNGTTWAGTGPPGDTEGNPAAVNAVGCAGQFCMSAGGSYSEVAGGDVATAGTWNARTQTWQDVSPNLGDICKLGVTTCTWASLVACGGPAICVTFGPSGTLAWNGSSWQPAPAVSAGRGSNLGDVSCGTAFCMAVGYRTVAGAHRTLAELWNGTTWQIISTPSPGWASRARNPGTDLLLARMAGFP